MYLPMYVHNYLSVYLSVCLSKDIYFKELAHTIVEAAKSITYRTGARLAIWA